MWSYSLLILIGASILPKSLAKLPEDEPVIPTDDCGNLHCLHQPVENCPAEEKCRCRRLHPNCTKAAICCNITDPSLLTDSLACAGIDRSKSLEALHIRNATFDTLDLTLWTKWKLLHHLSITDGSINKVVGEFSLHAMITCLNLSSNGIAKFEKRSLKNLIKLKVLDLSHNNLSDIPNFKKEGQVLLDISGNDPMLCTNVNEAIEMRAPNFKNANKTMCLSSKTFQWFNTTEQVPLSEVERYREYGKDCTELKCQCKLSRVDFIAGKVPTIAIEVDCSGLNLIALPAKLPPNTISLNVSNNNISSLQAIVDDESYENLRELDADNNRITSILPLEGSKFISSFVGLSLKNNQIEELPTYVLSNMFDRNYNSKHVYLGRNRVKCDCNTATVLKVWLLTKSKQIPDYNEIYCEGMDTKVIHLDPLKICQSQQEWTDYIYYIITAEVLLLVFLVAKVSYDYWVFKTAGYLPWPASKMPKLPCDWLCE